MSPSKRFQWALSGLLALHLAAPPPAAEAQVPGDSPPPPIVALSALPRLRSAWTLSGFETTQWRYEEGAPVFDGTLIAWTGTGPDRRLVAIELATGKERWRSAEP